ncbi:SDR family oxidoreductase [Moorena producens JHB]|uniref:SDR family oxidoreductase n=1 Tax=Moorena producens (strain JHB) TaxID=1454205 RepID=A0A1D9FWC7_MOOP1|nr:SDR family oxidoreductase [Moorena producens]AOY79688.1 SDR family oxidoreductase [Moorena producens JHB]
MAWALVTGGSKRIGKAIALDLAKHGYDLAIHYNRSRQDAEMLGEQIQSLDRNCRFYQADLTCDQDMLNLLPRVKADVPELDVLVNNASIFEPATLKETELDLFDSHFAVNFKAPYFFTRDFARLYQKGNIINIIDTRINKNDFSYSAYTLAKKALANLTEMAALELAPHIRVNGICPGWILLPAGASEQYIETLRQRVPMHSQGNVDQICQAVRYLLSNQFVTGQFLFVDGGQHL